MHLIPAVTERGTPGWMLELAVALDGRTAVIGSQLDDDKGSDSGSAYFFGP